MKQLKREHLYDVTSPRANSCFPGIYYVFYRNHTNLDPAYKMILHKSSTNSSISEPSKIVLPNYIPYGHSSTKWLLNTFRNGAHNRLMAMMKERPSMFKLTYQIFDRPAEVMADPTDDKSMFSTTSILYLKPLSLAVYMRCKIGVQILLSSNLCNSLEYGYASEVYVQLQGQNGGDLLELLPACIAVRRQCAEILPLLFQPNPWSQSAPFSPRTPFSMRYLSQRIQRTTNYDDIFHYVTEQALSNRYINIVKVLEILIFQCPGFYIPGSLDEDRKSKPCSLFRRLLHLAVYVDADSRICSPLLQCMEMLVKISHFRPEVLSTNVSSTSRHIPLNFSTVRKEWDELSEWTKDCYVCLALLFHLYALLLRKSKTNAVGHAGNLLFRVLNETGSFESTVSCPTDELARTLDYLTAEDSIGQLLLHDKRLPSSPKVRLPVESGDDSRTTSNKSLESRRSVIAQFEYGTETLQSIIDKLKARKSLAQIRQMHLMCLARSGRPNLNGLPVPKYRFAFSRFSTAIRNSQVDKMTCTFRHHFTNKLCRFTRWDEQSPLSMVLGTEIQKFHACGFRAAQDESVPRTSHSCQRARYKFRMVANDKDESNKNKAVKARINEIPKITTTPVDDEEDESSGEGHSVEPPPPRSFKPSTKNSTDIDAGKNSEQIDQNASETGSNCLEVPKILNRTQPKALKPEEQNKGENCDQTSASSPDRKNKKTSCKMALDQSSKQSVNTLLFQKPLRENLSLRDVDQLIDCITISALANEQELESQLIEDLFNDYLDQTALSSSNVSRTNSVIGTQIYTDQQEATNAVLVEPWPLPVETTIVTPEGEHCAGMNKVKVTEKPDLITSSEVLHTPKMLLAPDSESREYCAQSCTTNSQAVQNPEVDTFGPIGHRKFLWSCARPIHHLNVAFEALKQKSRNRHLGTQTPSPSIEQ
ncbi:unnamed protein product [Calicophoron daubneyi]|uniref:Uncharacterized protein n=1 Tax=Calicophoron daubneyi TaxID=300641 RepID=A0AAV2TGU2_CALDB